MLELENHISSLSDAKLLAFVQNALKDLGCHDINAENLWFNEEGIFSPLRSSLIAIGLLITGHEVKTAISYCRWLEKMDRALLACLEREEIFQKEDFFAVLEALFDVAKRFDNIDVPEIEFDGVKEHHSSHFSILTSVLGMNTGHGAIAAGRNQIVSFGPHYYPLGQMDKFGIIRKATRGMDSFQDVRFTSTPFSIKYWSKLVGSEVCDKPSAIWSEVEIEELDKGIQLTSRYENLGHETSFAFAFFIKSDCMIRGMQNFHQNTLERYRGPSETIICQSGEDRLEIRPCFKSYMQIIPLAGGNHFWGANFLLAYDVDNLQNPLRWALY